jgi:hypothetical protein
MKEEGISEQAYLEIHNKQNEHGLHQVLCRERDRDIDNILYGLHNFFSQARSEMMFDIPSASASSSEIDSKEHMP